MVYVRMVNHPFEHPRKVYGLKKVRPFRISSAPIVCTLHLGLRGLQSNLVFCLPSLLSALLFSSCTQSPFYQVCFRFASQTQERSLQLSLPDPRIWQFKESEGSTNVYLNIHTVKYRNGSLAMSGFFSRHNKAIVCTLAASAGLYFIYRYYIYKKQQIRSRAEALAGIEYRRRRVEKLVELRDKLVCIQGKDLHTFFSDC